MKLDRVVPDHTLSAHLMFALTNTSYICITVPQELMLNGVNS